MSERVEIFEKLDNKCSRTKKQNVRGTHLRDPEFLREMSDYRPGAEFEVF